MSFDNIDYNKFLDLNQKSKRSKTKGLRILDFVDKDSYVILEELDTGKQRRLGLTYLYVAVGNKSVWLSNPSKLRGKFNKIGKD